MQKYAQTLRLTGKLQLSKRVQFEEKVPSELRLILQQFAITAYHRALNSQSIKIIAGDLELKRRLRIIKKHAKYLKRDEGRSNKHFKPKKLQVGENKVLNLKKK